MKLAEGKEITSPKVHFPSTYTSWAGKDALSVFEVLPGSDEAIQHWAGSSFHLPVPLSSLPLLSLLPHACIYSEGY